MKKLISMFLLITLTACISAHKENLSEQTGAEKDVDVKVSVEKNKRLSTENFVVLEYTLENKGSEYKRYEKIDLNIDEKLNDDVKIVVGQDLVNWAEGIKNKVELDDYNQRTIMAGVTALAGATAALSKDQNLARLSGGVAVAGAGTLTVDSFTKIRDNLKNSNKADTRGLIPESHIMATPVSLPPNLFLKRFAVFYVKGEGKDEFYTMDLALKGTGETKDVALVSAFDKAPSGTSCKENKNSMVFRGFKIECEEDCKQLHPLNQDNCQKAYRKKFG